MTRRGLALGTVAAAGLLAFAVSWLAIDPHLEEADAYPGGLVLRDAAGRVLRVSLGPGDTDCRPYYRAAPEDWIVKALIASEDRRFYSHSGVNLPSVLRACLQNLMSLRRVSGASTITMQATRLIRPHPRTLAWKYVEAFRAMRTERARDKMWIISQYLNRAPFGSNLVGVEAAANGWFGKRAKDLGIGEAALLAGLVQSPSRFRPDRHLDRALKRREYVLGRMAALGMIDARQHAAARAARPDIRRGPRPFLEPYFCDWAQRRAARGGLARGDARTTLDADLQARAARTVAKAAAGGLSAAAVVMEARTGAVRALACSGDYFGANAGQVNTALAPRPAGSTLKPFLAAMAMDAGLMTPEERLADVPKAYRGYAPANFDASYRGEVTLADALVLSLNLPFVQLLQRAGVPRFGTLLRSLGLHHLSEEDASFGLGMAIGNVEVSLVELVGAYGCLARGGTWIEPCALAREVEDAAKDPPLRVFSEGACALVAEMLSGEARASTALGHMADVKAARFAWKTGTSAAYRDAWTVLWNPEYVVGVWCGHKQDGFGDATVVGALAAAPFAWELARGLYPAGVGPWYAPSPEVATRRVCAASGLPAAPECPATEEGRCLRGRSSAALCGRHRRGADGRTETVRDGFLAAFSGAARTARRLAIVKPAADTEFHLVPGIDQQRVVCAATGNTPDGRLWWFVDGRPLGETRGDAPFVWTPAPGEHVVTCASAEGVTASAPFKVLAAE